MKSNYNQLGQYIEMVSRTNSDLKYGIEDVRGCSNTKQMMQTRANLIGRTYEKFIVLRPQEFVFNRRTTRNGEKIGMAYNNTDRDYIFTNDYVAFRVKQGYLDKLKRNIIIPIETIFLRMIMSHLELSRNILINCCQIICTCSFVGTNLIDMLDISQLVVPRNSLTGRICVQSHLKFHQWIFNSLL